MSEEKTSSAPRPPVLEAAWRRFAEYDQNAVRLQKSYLRIRFWIARLGVAATFLAVLYTFLSGRFDGSPLGWALRLLVIVAPITAGVLTAGIAKVDRGLGWVLLRGSAESLKRETYRYRARVGPYNAAHTQKQSRDEKLAEKVERIGRNLARSDVAQAGLVPYADDAPLPPRFATAPEDDGFSDLDSERYLEVRLLDQLAYYRKKALELDLRYRRIQWSVVVLGGVGTLLAALSLELWIPVSVSLAGALAGLVELLRLETAVPAFTKSAMDLDNVRVWWSAIEPSSRVAEVWREQLVAKTEAVLKSEQGTWQEDMEEAIRQFEKAIDETQSG